MFLSAIASGGVAGSVIIWLSREWISARLKGSIQHEYDQKLELHKAQLKAEHEVAILNIKTSLEREATLHTVAHASFAAGQKASMERKLNAVDRLWSHVVKLRTTLPPILTFIDILTIDEYRAAKDHPQFQALSGDISDQKIVSFVDTFIEHIRPYVGEYIWALYFCYQAIFLRLLMLLHLGRDDASKLDWHKDDGIRQLMAAVLTPKEIEQFDQTRISKVSWLQRQLETKLLIATQNITSGEGFGAESLDQARLIQQRVAALGNPS